MHWTSKFDSIYIKHKTNFFAKTFKHVLENLVQTSKNGFYELMKNEVRRAKMKNEVRENSENESSLDTSAISPNEFK